MTIVCMLQTVAGSAQKCQDICGRRGFEERQVKDAADKLGIAVHDHVVIAKAGHASFRALGLL